MAWAPAATRPVWAAPRGAPRRRAPADAWPGGDGGERRAGGGTSPAQACPCAAGTPPWPGGDRRAVGRGARGCAPARSRRHGGGGGGHGGRVGARCAHGEYTRGAAPAGCRPAGSPPGRHGGGRGPSAMPARDVAARDRALRHGSKGRLPPATARGTGPLAPSRGRAGRAQAWKPGSVTPLPMPAVASPCGRLSPSSFAEARRLLHAWRPHSVLVKPAQRPARGSSSGPTGRVQGAHPMLG